jgi:hypothetical protein
MLYLLIKKTKMKTLYQILLIRGGETLGYSTYLLEVSSYREMLRFVSKMKRS